MPHGVKEEDAHAGAHTQFKNQLKAELHKKVSGHVAKRAGPSFDERMAKAVKGFQARAAVTEAEMNKNLSEAIEKGRSRETSCPIRSNADAPNQHAMLVARKKAMREQELAYRDEIDRLKDKMLKREPLFRLSDVNAAFAMQRDRAVEKKRAMAQDEHERWEHLKEVEMRACLRGLLIEDSGHKVAPKKVAASASSPELGKADEEGGIPKNGMFGRPEYEKDIKIANAIEQPWFKQTEWAKEVGRIRERADNRIKLHEEKYPQTVDGSQLARSRMMHNSPAQVKGVF